MSLTITPMQPDNNLWTGNSPDNTNITYAEFETAWNKVMTQDENGMPFLPSYTSRVLNVIITIEILEVIAMLYHLSFNLSNSTSIIMVCTLWLALIVLSAVFSILALKCRSWAVVHMGIVGFMLVLVNTVIDFLLFWDNGISTYVIPCQAISILVLIQIPTVINYNVLLYMFLWAAYSLGVLLVLSLTEYFTTEFVVTLVVMIFAVAGLANVSSYQNFRKIKGSYFGTITNNTGFQRRIDTNSPLLQNTALMSETISSGIEILVMNIIRVQKILQHETNQKNSKSAHLLTALDLISNTKSEISEKENVYKVMVENFEKITDADDLTFLVQNFTEEKKADQSQTCPRIRRREDRLLSIGASVQHKKAEKWVFKLGENWNLNLFKIDECTKHPILVCGKFILMKNDLDKAFSIDEGKYHEFFRDMEERYLPNPYHNATHAADVLNSILYLINQTPLSKKITELELLGVIIASLGHDVAHPALNNRFLVNNAHKIAVKYNDVSVLENMHSAIVFKLLMSEDKNILENLDSADWFYIRRVIVEMILITDMAKHFELLGLFRVKLQNGTENDLSNSDEKIFMLKYLIKCADIGHAAKKVSLHEQWSIKVCEEFFNQGDREKSLSQPVSMFCDRDDTNIAKSQAGFIQNLVLPLYDCINQFFNSIQIEKMCLQQLNTNHKHWISLDSSSQTNSSSDLTKPEKTEQERNHELFQALADRTDRNMEKIKQKIADLTQDVYVKDLA